MISFPTILLRLILALVLGALVGLERESHVQAAGLRTNALVALGSALFMTVSMYGFLDFLTIPHIQVDPSRVASYIVAGIGFLGGGVIFMSRDQDRVKGLTTAAAIWIVAAIGMACGAGLLLEAITATILALMVLVLLRYVELFIPFSHLAKVPALHIETNTLTGQFIGQVYDICTRAGITVEKLEVHKGQEVEAVEVECQSPGAGALARAVSELQALPGIRAVHADLRGAKMGGAALTQKAS